MTSPSEDFYLDLPGFSDFREIGYLAAYKPVPDDWIVLAADIVQSRKAIASGRQKDVNMIGAGVIAAVLNVLGRDRVPFVFGGDGATIIVPGSDAKAGREALAGMARLAYEQTGLELRIAAIPVAVLRNRGRDIRLRKYLLEGGNALAMAIGGGLELADEILKSASEIRPFTIEVTGRETPDLTGLSCRWEDIPAANGRIVSLIIRPTPGPDAEKTIARLRRQFERLLGRDLFGEGDHGRFVAPNRLRFRFPPRGLGKEIRLVGASRGRFRTLARSLMECVVFLAAWTLRKQVGPLDPESYLEELSRQTDHRKLDDCLRLVLDLHPGQVSALRHYLEEMEARNELTFGLHETSSATMTCFVSDLGAGRHLHFIDGAGGGLSAAATSMAIGLRDQREKRPSPLFMTPAPWAVNL